MQRTKTELRASYTLIWMCFTVYAMLSMSKTAYSSSMAAIINDSIFTKSQAGIINSSFYFLYGIAQLLGAKLIDKISPAILLTIALLGTTVASIGMAVADSFVAMLIIWSLCGLCQFAAWPCIIKIIAEYLFDEHRPRAMTYIAFAYCLGNLLNYFTASFILSFTSWRTIFVMNSVILGILLLFWLKEGLKASRILAPLSLQSSQGKFDSAILADKSEHKISYSKLLMISGILMLLAPGFIRTALDLGIKSWVPTMLMEIYKITPSFATALTTVLMIINLSGVFIANFIYPKYFKNPVSALNACFIVSLPITLLLLLIGKLPIAIIILMLIFVTTMMYCGNQLLNVVVPSFFNKYNRSGSIAGILNAAASFGAVASNFGYGYLADRFGWTGTIISWSIMGVVSIIFCALAVPLWKSFTKK